jgi:23S rRNA (cytosine1962-C5)-methyltransferase
MFTSDQYQLIDFGNARRLERFGPWLLDRPCPSAEGFTPANPKAWASADARFNRRENGQGRWTANRELPQTWPISHGRMRLELKCTAVGHLGLFPEQADNWDWIAEQVARAERPPKVLNLFAYTGGSSLAAAAAGAEVVHLDAAKNTVAWARRNAQLSQMSDLPIRWIAEDAAKFLRRELKRENRYDAIILDPPSYGHGARGEVWRISEHLEEVLQMCAALTCGGRQFMLLTCHTPGYEANRLAEMTAEAFGDGNITAKQMTIRSASGERLPAGVVVRCTHPTTLETT